ncbi:hypothetical protein BGZ96_002884 [Linnemannia gamsii]|uniref:Arm-like repeat domain-containing protein n=1 Tax=Linnemannia gamsii TaxID=64522 RepID=A0ABQ7JKE1_9FUNG|nr:hypothetical protein BGZ96_002884 [Linnemannia gamsii]
MFELHTKHALSASQSLEIIQTLLKNGGETKDATVRLVFCNKVETLLGHMKKLIKKTNASNNDDGNQALREGIATAYLDHANLMAELGHPEQAQISRRQADKWGGLGIKKTVVPPVKRATQAMNMATVPDSIFPDNVSPLTSAWTFPDPDGRVADTPQLVSCLGLLKQRPDELPEDVLEPVAWKWLKETALNPDEKPRLEALVTDLIRAFTRDEIKDKKAVAEVLCLVPVLGEDDTRVLLRQFQNNIEGSHILDIGALRGLAQLLQSANPAYLHAQDLIEVLASMSKRLQETHEQSQDHIIELTVAVSSVLDAMADTKVTGLDREGLHEPLLTFLGGFQGSDDPHLKYYVSYAFQALLCVPDDESPWQATVRRTTKFVKGISGLVSAIKGLDLNGFMAGLQSIQEGFQGAQQVFELASIKEGLTFNRKRAWYSALRGADTLIDGGELARFRILVCGAPCRRELAFQWGVCQRLGGLAANTLWDVKIRRGAVRFLEEIYRNDLVWGPLPPIKLYILNILKQLATVSKDLPDAVLLLENLANDGDAAKQDIYRSFTTKEHFPDVYFLNSGHPEFAYPSFLDRVQQKTEVEVDLRRILRMRIKESDSTVYIPPLAKTHLQASDDVFFPLTPMVDEFLSGDKKVLLLLGDSGAGKTTFNRELDCALWNRYKPRTGRIPLLISLPAINRPEKDLIANHLRINEFSEPQIRELKGREFVIICDGYDESQLSQNLYEMNGFNKNGGWQVQMIISCRSEHLGPDYRDLFQPARSSTTDPELFKQAVLVPFSPSQIKDYIARYVIIKRPLWGPSDYEGVLDQIPSLQDLVKNPFLLSLALEVLPRITDPNQKLTANKITRVLLYDEFVAQWLERNKKRFTAQGLSDVERKALENLSEDGFTQRGLTFLKDLSAAIYNEQEGNPVVEYSKARDAGTWKERFFDRKDEETQMLRKAIPMTRNGSRFGFIHRSILEYGVSRAIYEPQHQTGLRLEAAAETDSYQLRRRKSSDSVYSFEELPLVTKKAVASIETRINLESLLARRSFVKDPSVMQFLVERVQSERIFEEELIAYIHASKTNKSWRTAAANAMTILVRAGIHFSHQDLRGIQVPGADMSFGVFGSAQLQNADLRKTNLQNVWFREANLSNSRMDGVRFGEWPPLSDVKMSYAFAYTLDGETFVAGTQEGKILLYNPSTWAVVATLEGHDLPVTDIVVSPDGSLMASGADTHDGEMSARVWDLMTGKCLHVLEGHSKWFTGLIFLQDDRHIVTGSCCRSVYLWELETGTCVHSFEVPEDHAAVTHIACTRDGKMLACSYEDRSMRLWDIETAECLRVLESCLEEYDDSVGIAFSPDGRCLSWTSIRKLKTWNIAEGAEFWTLDSIFTFSAAVYSPDGRKVACQTTENMVSLLDPETGKAGVTLRGHLGIVIDINFSPDGTQIATASDDRTVRLWDSQTGTPGPVFEGHSSRVVSVKFSPNGRQVVSSTLYDEAIRVWDNQTANTLNIQPRLSHCDYPHVTFVPGGQYMVSFCKKWLRIWNRESGKPMHCLAADSFNDFGTVVSSPCGGHLISAGINPSVLLWEVETGKCLFSLATTEKYDGNCRRVAFSSDGHRVATSGGICAFDVMIWNRATGELECQLSGHMGRITELLFSSNGSGQLVSFTDDSEHWSGHDRAVRLWDISMRSCTATLEDFKEPATKSSILSTDRSSSRPTETNALFMSGTQLQEHDSGLSTLDAEILGSSLQEVVCRTVTSLSPDGRWLASSCTNEAVQLWDLETGKLIAETEHSRGIVSSLALEESSAAEAGEERKYEISLAVGNGEGDISFWKLVKQDSALREVEMEGVKDTIDMRCVGDGIDGKTYEFELQWTTAYGKLNAEGAKIEGVQGLSRANGRLLNQNGALGKPTVGLHHAVTKMTMTKKVVS